MRILIVRSAAADCEPSCAEWISAEGDITATTPALLRKVLKATGGRKLPFILTSPGGDVTAGYAMGRLIRRAGLEVTIGRTMLASCKPDERNCTDTTLKGRRGWANNVYSFCNSACVFVLAGGAARHAYWMSPIGVHQFASTRTLTRWRDTTLNGRLIRRQILSVNRVAVKTSRIQYDQAARFFDEMGVDSRINGLLQLADNKNIHLMSRGELLETKIITDGQDAGGQILKFQAALDAQKISEHVTPLTATATDIPAGLYQGKAIISHVELRQDPKSVDVMASITPTIGASPLPAAELLAGIQIGKRFAFSDPPDGRTQPDSALTIALAPTTFCALEHRRSLNFTIRPKRRSPVTSETVWVSTGRFRDLDLLLGKVCGKQQAVAD